MSSFEIRIFKLEKRTTPEIVLSAQVGRLTVKLDIAAAQRQLAFSQYGFDIELLNPPPAMRIPRDATQGEFKTFNLDKITAQESRYRGALKELATLDDDARIKLAKQKGYRIIYQHVRGSDD